MLFRHGSPMWKIPPSVAALCPQAHSELRDVVPAARGGVSWDPFSAYPKVRLTAEAHRELLGVLGDGGFSSCDAQWVRTCVLASVAPLLASRVRAAVQRFHKGPGEEADLMAVALEVAQSALSSWSPVGTASFHGYLIRAADAALSRAAGMDSSHGEMPRSWRYAMRMLPSLRDDFRAREGRDATVDELRAEYLARSRRWAERLSSAAGEVGDAPVEARLRGAGVFAVADRFAEVCAAEPAPMPLDMPGWDVALGAEDTTESMALLREGEARARAIGDLLDDLGASGPADAVHVLSTPAAALFARKGALPVRELRVRKRAPSDAELLDMWMAGGR